MADARAAQPAEPSRRRGTSGVGRQASPPTRPPARPQVAELEDRWRRPLADLDNLRKRYARELGRERDGRAGAGSPRVAAGAGQPRLRAGARRRRPGPIVEGVRAVRDQALAVLAGLGYPRARTRRRCRSTRPGTRRSASSTTDGRRAAGHGRCRSCGPATATDERQLRPAAVVVADQERS